MSKTSPNLLEPRKAPQQKRSIATVESICEAAVQVLLTRGKDHLTTNQVVDRAGVSIGTFYQYFPNKQTLLSEVLERHLSLIANAVEAVCHVNHSRPLEVMAEALVDRFVEAKFADQKIAVILYQIAGDVGGDLIVDRYRVRCQRAIADMLHTADGLRATDLNTRADIIFLTLAGVLRGYLEREAPQKLDSTVRKQLAKLIVELLRDDLMPLASCAC